MPDFKPLLAVDFDGCVHAYSQGWTHPDYQPGVIYDPVVEGFWEWAAQAAAAFTLVIYSSRSKTREGRDTMRQWMANQWAIHCLKRQVAGTTHHEGELEDAPAALTVASPLDEPMTFSFAAEKPAAWLTIDDRAVRFDGHWDDPALSPKAMLAFKPWMTRHRA